MGIDMSMGRAMVMAMLGLLRAVTALGVSEWGWIARFRNVPRPVDMDIVIGVLI